MKNKNIFIISLLLSTVIINYHPVTAKLETLVLSNLLTLIEL